MFPAYWAIIVLFLGVCWFIGVIKDAEEGRHSLAEDKSIVLAMSILFNIYLVPVVLRFAYLLFAPEAQG